MANNNTKRPGNASAPIITPAGPALTDAERQLVVKTIMNNTPLLLGGKRFAEVDPFCLLVGPPYQRRPNMDRVQRIAEQWDVRKSEIITCSYRDNELWVVNGQHRTLAARINHLPSVAVEILTGLTAQEEALLFSNQDDNKQRVNHVAKFNADLFAGVPDAVALRDLLVKYGIMVATQKPEDTDATITNCMAVLRSKMRNAKFGPACIDWIFDIMKQATWLGASGAVVTKNINSLSQVWQEAVLDCMLPAYTDNLISFMSQVSPTDFQTLAAARYENMSDHRTQTKSMFFAVARGHVQLNNRIAGDEN